MVGGSEQLEVVAVGRNELVEVVDNTGHAEAVVSPREPPCGQNMTSCAIGKDHRTVKL